MTISTTSNTVVVQGNGLTTSFSFSFPVPLANELYVYYVDTTGAVTLLQPNQYSVSGIGTPVGGAVTYPLTGSPIPTGSSLIIQRLVSYQQLTSLINQSGYYPNVVEGALDYLTMQTQQLAQMAGLALQVPPSAVKATVLLPSAAGRANQLVGFDAGGNAVMYPVTASVGAGNLTNEGPFVAGVNFTPGVTTTLTLSQAYSNVANVQVHFDGTYQGPDQYSLSGTQLIFTSPIPVGVNKVYVIGGTTLSVGVPTQLTAPGGSTLVGYQRTGSGTTVRTVGSKLQDVASVFDYGALGNGSSNDSAAFATAIPALLVPPGTGNFVVSSNTTVTADLIFMGGVISVPTGVTLTINGGVIAASKVIFTGAGTVVVNRGIIDVAWFDGTDASSKTAFCLRGVSNTNGTGKVLAYYPPQPGDAWATQSANLQWGYGWKVTAPIDLEQAQAYTMYLTYSSFVVTQAVAQVFLLGNAATKSDGQNFPLRLKIDGGNGLATWAFQAFGASHLFLDYVEAYYCGGIALTPNGSKQVSGVQINYLDTGALYGPAIKLDGSAGASNTVTDVEIGFVSSTGFVTGHASNAVVQINSNCNGITLRKVTHRAVNAGFVDASGAVVSIYNAGDYGTTNVSCRYGMNIGPVLNGSTSITAYAVQVADGSAGAAAKMTGITLDAGSQVDGGALVADIVLAYTSGAIVKGLPGASSTNSARKLNIASTCADTFVYGMTPSQVTDGGANTLINGHNYGAISALAAPGSGNAWVNNNHYPVLFQMQGATAISNVVYTRGATSLTVANSGTAGAWLVAPGDNIAVSYTGAPAFNLIPM